MQADSPGSEAGGLPAVPGGVWVPQAGGWPSPPSTSLSYRTQDPPLWGHKPQAFPEGTPTRSRPTMLRRGGFSLGGIKADRPTGDLWQLGSLPEQPVALSLGPQWMHKHLL